jgi:hypothetical protein
MHMDNGRLIYNPRFRICKTCGHENFLYKFLEASFEDDEMMPNPAPRRQGTIPVTLVYGGKGEPPVAEDPWANFAEQERQLISRKMLYFSIASLVIVIMLMLLF